MKKMVLGLSLSLAAFGFLVSPTVAAASPSPAAPVLSLSDQAFLATLAGVPAGTPAPELAAKGKRPAIGVKSFCSANCANGGTVSCSGTSCSAVNGSCPSEPGHVTCDGLTTSCSACGPYCNNDPNFCADQEANCAWECNPCDYNFSCDDVTCNTHCRCIFATCPQ